MPIAESVRLQTKRLRLRELHAADAVAVREIFGDPEVVQFTEWDPFTHETDALRLIDWASNAAQKEPRTAFAFAMVLAPGEDAETVIGICTLVVRDRVSQDAALGYILGRKWWGYGFAAEAAQALIDFGFGQLRLHRIHAQCRPVNTRSQRVMEKAGMRWEGHLRQNRWEKDAWQDTVIYAILHDEWESGHDR